MRLRAKLWHLAPAPLQRACVAARVAASSCVAARLTALMAPCIAKPIRLCLQQAVQCLLDAASHDLPQMIFYPTGVDTEHVRQALRVILVQGGSGLLYWLLRLATESLRDAGPPTTHKCAKLSLRHLRTSRSSARRATISLSVMSLSVSIRVSLDQAHDEAFMPIKARPASTTDRLRLHLTGFRPLSSSGSRAMAPHRTAPPHHAPTGPPVMPSKHEPADRHSMLVPSRTSMSGDLRSDLHHPVTSQSIQ